LRQALARRGGRPTWSPVDMFTQLIAAYTRMKDYARLQPIIEEAERAGALSRNGRSAVAQGFAERGLYPEAERQLLLVLEPDQPMDTVTRAGIGGWATRMDLAHIYEKMGNAEAALRQVELGLADPDLHERGAVADTAARLAVEVGDMASLGQSLEAVTQPGDADLEGQLRLLELRSMAGPASTTLDALDPIDRAIALGDWQSAYDLALTLSGRTMAEAARQLFVSIRLQRGGAAQAALNLLGRLHDTQPALPEVHALLTTVLKDLGRYDDALAANQILQQLLAA
jgi:tetratricopeptide (TPR) repeat protein